MNSKNKIIYFGRVTKIRDFLESYEAKNTLLIRGDNSYTMSGAKVIEPIIRRFSDEEFPIDCIVAVGGGSVIDKSKLLASQSQNRPLLIAIPTTCGSGSESTSFATVYENGVKKSVNTKAPDIAIVDYELMYSQSPQQIAISGFDALAHAVESYWSKRATSESRKLSKRAYALIRNNLVLAYYKNNSGIKRMAQAANLAGRAINIARTTGAHALSYNLTSYLGVPHGQAVALFLPRMVRRYKHQLVTADELEHLIKQLGLRNRLTSKEKKVVLDLGFDPVRMSNNPEEFTKQELGDLLR